MSEERNITSTSEEEEEEEGGVEDGVEMSTTPTAIPTAIPTATPTATAHCDTDLHAAVSYGYVSDDHLASLLSSSSPDIDVHARDTNGGRTALQYARSCTLQYALKYTLQYAL